MKNLYYFVGLAGSVGITLSVQGFLGIWIYMAILGFVLFLEEVIKEQS